MWLSSVQQTVTEPVRFGKRKTGLRLSRHGIPTIRLLLSPRESRAEAREIKQSMPDR
jgi:hypothetical protein